MPADDLLLIDSPDLGMSAFQAGAVPVNAPALRQPNHLAIIPDGNRRWARGRGLTTADGHRTGFLETAPRLLEYLFQAGLPHVTLWMFSPENWRREQAEVDNLMDVYAEFLIRMKGLCRSQGYRINHLGRRDRLPDHLVEELDLARAATADGRRGTFHAGLDYGAETDVADLVRWSLSSGLPKDASDEQIADRLARRADPPGPGARPPSVDLIIRTSGEQRLSGFMPFEGRYSELYFTRTAFPAFDVDELAHILDWFQGRCRRFGG